MSYFQRHRLHGLLSTITAFSGSVACGCSWLRLQGDGGNVAKVMPSTPPCFASLCLNLVPGLLELLELLGLRASSLGFKP